MKVKIGKLKEQDSNCCLPLDPLYNNRYNMAKLSFKYTHTFTHKNNIIMQTHMQNHIIKNKN